MLKEYLLKLFKIHSNAIALRKLLQKEKCLIYFGKIFHYILTKSSELWIFETFFPPKSQFGTASLLSCDTTQYIFF